MLKFKNKKTGEVAEAPARVKSVWLANGWKLLKDDEVKSSKSENKGSKKGQTSKKTTKE